MHHITISLTTISSRIERVHHVVASLLAQNFSKKAFTIELHVSEQPYLLDEGCADLPVQLVQIRDKHPDRFKIVYGANIGPYRKILPLLDRLFALPAHEFARQLIVTADDDTIYPPHWLEALYTHYLKHRCVIGFRGRVMDFHHNCPVSYSRWEKEIGKNPCFENVPTGKDGVMYSVMNLHPSVRDRAAARRHAEKADDLWLKAHSLLLQVPSYLIHERLEIEFDSIESGKEDLSLYKVFNKQGGNDAAVRNIDAYLAENFNTSFMSLCRRTEAPMARWHATLAASVPVVQV